MPKKLAVSKKGKSTSVSQTETMKAGRRVSTKPKSKEEPIYDESETSNSEEESGDDSDVYNNSTVDDGDALSLDSDALDDSDFDGATKSGKRRKRTSVATKASPSKGSSATSSPKKSNPSPAKRRKVSTGEDDEDLKEGQEIVGTVVQAPKTGRVPPGRISQNTFNFLKQLMDPECNDRTWFKLHEPVFRQAEKEWKDFIIEFTPLLTEADSQIPPLPPNDVVHRIYRDVRFSNDKTPYKTNFSASFSRSGRKGIFAGYHLSVLIFVDCTLALKSDPCWYPCIVKPEGGSLFAAGTWCPGKNELQTIRNHIARSSRSLRQIISEPEFVKLFGEAKPHPKGERRNIFGSEDELKTAPKGISKAHKDIDLLKCRSFAVFHKFTDKQILDPNFNEELKRIVEITRPFVHRLNDMMTVEPDDEDGSDGEE